MAPDADVSRGDGGDPVSPAELIAELGPWPWPAAPVPLDEAFLARRPWLDLPDAVDAATMTVRLEALAAACRDWHARDRRRDRPREVPERFERLEAMARRLATGLAALDVTERQMLWGAFGGHFFTGDLEKHPERPDLTEWRRLEASIRHRLPAWMDRDARLAQTPGNLEDDLRDLADHLRTRRIQLRDGDPALRDRGGAWSIGRRIASASPSSSTRPPRAVGREAGSSAAPSTRIAGSGSATSGRRRDTRPHGRRRAT